MTMLELPTAIHRGDDELPWVDIGGGSLLKVLQVKEREGLWVIRNRFMPGYLVQTHKHTGPVYAFTTSGAWKYKESDFVNRAGTWLKGRAALQQQLGLKLEQVQVPTPVLIVDSALEKPTANPPGVAEALRAFGSAVKVIGTVAELWRRLDRLRRWGGRWSLFGWQENTF